MQDMRKPQQNPKEKVVIVGGGVTGCALGALLASQGIGVRLMEKEPFWGGRAGTRSPGEWGWTTEPYKDYKVDYGHHVFAAGSFIEKALEDTGAGARLTVRRLHMPYFMLKGRLFSNPDNVFSGLLTSIPALFRIGIRDLMKMNRMRREVSRISSSEAIEKYSDLPLDQYLSRFNYGQAVTELIVEGLVAGYTTEVKTGDIPTADFMIGMKLMENGLKKRGTSTLYPQGGFARLPEAFVGIIESAGSQADVNMPLEKIEVKKNGDGYHVAAVVAGGQRMEASTVVCTFPCYYLSRYLPQEVTGTYKEFFNRLQEGEKSRSMLFLVVCGTDQMLAGKPLNTWVFVPRSQLRNFREYFLIEEMDHTYGIAPEGRRVISFATLVRDQKTAVDVMGRKMKEDIERLFPGFSFSRCEWTTARYFSVVDGIARTVQWYGKKRPGPKTPIRGLFIAGDSTQEYSTGTDGCVHSAFITAGEILGKKLADIDDILG